MNNIQRPVVCHISSLHKRYDVRIFQKECTTLSRNNYKVFYCVNDLNKEEIINDVHIISTNIISKSMLHRLVIANRKLIKLALSTNADIIHIHDPELLLYYRKLKKKGKVVIYDSHEFYYYQILNKHYIPRIFRKTIALVYKFIENNALNHIDAVIFPCTINNSLPIKKTKAKIEIIGNMPILESFNNQNHNKIISSVIYIGAITEQRGIINNVIAAYNANYKFLLAGNFNDDAFHSRLKEMKEYSCVSYFGSLNSLEVVDLLSTARVGFSTLLNQGQYGIGDNFPTKVYEYMSMGIPVIISKGQYVDDIFRKTPFGISVDPNDIDQITNALINLRDNEELYKVYSLNGRQLVKEKFNWNIEAEKLLQLYQNISILLKE